MLTAAAGLIATLLSACSPGAPAPEDAAASPSEPAATNSQGPEALVRMGDFARDRGEIDSAISLYRQAHLAEPQATQPLLRLGLALAETGQFQESGGAFQTALDLEPANVEAKRGLGNAQIGLGQAESALITLQSIDGYGENASVLNSIGVARDLLGRHDEARTAYQDALAITPRDLDLASNLALSHSLSDNHNEAIAQMRLTAAAPLATPRHRRNLAMLLYFAGSEVEAREVLGRDYSEQEVAIAIDRFARWNAIDDSGAKAAAISSGG